MADYYNEIDPFAAAWLRALMKAGQIPDGEVDERSIELVQPDDVRGFRQCHFFAGIGGWAYALQLAGWPDDRRVWTGSCPCQPWSLAGRGEGANDPRHLWPTWSRLIEVCRPPVVFGEQVTGEDGRYWLDLVFADMEARDYAIAAFDLPACGIGAPHKRSRFWFVAEAEPVRTPVGDERCGCWDRNAFHRTVGMFPGERCANMPRPLDHAERGRAERIASGEGREESASSRARQSQGRGRIQTVDTGDARVLGDTNGARLALRSVAQIGRGAIRHEGATIGATGATRGFWERCEWIYHDDGVYRAVESESFPLAPRLPGDMEQIRAYGNAIVPQVAQVFIESYLDVRRG